MKKDCSILRHEMDDFETLLNYPLFQFSHNKLIIQHLQDMAHKWQPPEQTIQNNLA